MYLDILERIILKILSIIPSLKLAGIKMESFFSQIPLLYISMMSLIYRIKIDSVQGDICFAKGHEVEMFIF